MSCRGGKDFLNRVDGALADGAHSRRVVEELLQVAGLGVVSEVATLLPTVSDHAVANQSGSPQSRTPGGSSTSIAASLFPAGEAGRS